MDGRDYPSDLIDQSTLGNYRLRANSYPNRNYVPKKRLLVKAETKKRKGVAL